MELRSPIVCVVGHVDHGKTTLLDQIRGTAVAAKEAGAITQHIGATEVSRATIARLTAPLQKQEAVRVKGLLFIDTPGHHAFTTLRARGTSLADLAVLVVDVADNFQQQTAELLKMLRRFKTPFVVAANKIDRLPSFAPSPGEPFVTLWEGQPERWRLELEQRLYNFVGRFSEHGYSAERYDRIRDFARNIAVVPMCARTGEGIPDLLLVLVGLAQRFLAKELEVDPGAPGHGTVLEVKEEKGHGVVLDAVLWDGSLRKGDSVAVATGGEPAVARARTLLLPGGPAETVTAAAGVRLVAPGLERAVPGMPLRVVPKGEQGKVVSELKAEVSEMAVKTDPLGVFVKADTLGSLEALTLELRGTEIPVQKAVVGDVSRRDVVEAAALKERNPLLSVLLGFNVRVLPEAQEEAHRLGVPLFNGDVIYKLITEYREWLVQKREAMEKARLDSVARAAKFQVLPDHVFRASKPMVVGVRVLAGTLRPGVDLMNREGKPIGQLKSIQKENKPVQEARSGDEVAVSIDGPTFGRQVRESDILYVEMNERDVRLSRGLAAKLPADEMEALEEIVQKRRAVTGNPLWGVGA
ncbi:MAG: translation initiation factor IF-2 [Halobacteria archaeon]